MSSLNLSKIHTNLIGNSTSYVKSLEKTAFNRREGRLAFVEELNKEVDAFLIESERELELFATEVDYLTFIGGDGDYADGMEDRDKDLCYVFAADTGLNILGSKIELALGWDDIRHMLIHDESLFSLETFDGGKITIGNTFLLDIFKELFFNLNDDESLEDEIPVYREIKSTTV